MTNVNSYSGLQQAIREWANRTDTEFINNIPLFISLSEQQFFMDCPLLGSEVYASGTFAVGNPRILKPALWGQNLSLLYLDDDDNWHILKKISNESIYTYNNKSTGKLDAPNELPLYYADEGYDYLLISPTPQSAFTYVWAFFQKIAPLSFTNTSNWITQNAYDILFYACMQKAYLFIDNQQNAEIFRALYQERAQAYLKYDADRHFDRSQNALKG